MRELVRHRDYRLLLTGQTLSMFGDTAMLLVLAMWAKQLTGSSSVAGSVFAAVVAPSLFAPFSGILIDRFRRRQVMIAVDLATSVAVLALLFVTGRGDLWLLYVVAFVYGTSLIAFQSARSALLHTMLREDLLGPANGLLDTVRQSLRLVAPLAGAALFAAFGGRTVALLDAATFLVSAGTLALMRTAEPRPRPERVRVLTGATAGSRHLLSSPVLRATTVACVVCFLVLGLSETVIFAVVDDGLHRPVAFLGVLGFAQGVGAVAAGLATTLLIRRVGELRPIAVGLALMAAGCGFKVGSGVATVCAGMFLVGAGLTVSIVAVTTTIQRRTPGPLQGRAFTAFELLVGVPQLVSILVGAALVSFVDYRVLLVIMTTGLALAAGYAALTLREPARALAYDADRRAAQVVCESV